ncbi:hypothetical protein IGB42_01908 [Andreprevotia sp. IGB-42]|uniref:sulfite exporter TauE/SafE family protein n=1 Tax=Andreprevotia sp. IGB-42 TaxID=2497473 RepID=UPI00135AAE3A|nr:sulfite exporter TauE/SafE family protein [Andreprevotia sp. IGB-42]KAF0813557.1 hypothetical protein IGB42_01908 [Andreprevotia sp. IGB-42]
MHVDLALLLTGAVVAGFVQGLSGFAFSMVSMSFWAWGLEPGVAMVLAVFGGLTGQLMAAFTTGGRKLNLATLLPFLAGGITGIPLGVALLPHLNPLWFKVGLGLMLACWCPLMLFANRIPRIESGGRLADGAVGMVGGLMGALGGFCGVAPTLWCTLRGYDKQLQRAVIQNFNLAALTVTMAIYVGTGAVTSSMLPLFAIMVPALLIPTLLGSRLYTGLSDLAFRRVVLSLLTASGIAMLAAALPPLWHGH